VNGQVQEPGAQADYTLSGNTVTFNSLSIPPNGARISFRYGFSTTGGSGNTGGVAATTGMQVFTTGGTFTVAAGVTRVMVQVWSGGSGGEAGSYASGPGGSGGGYAQNWCAVNPGDTIAVTVGAGGAGGLSSVHPTGGGNSSFGTCATAIGASLGVNDPSIRKPGYDAALGNVGALYYARDVNGYFSKIVTLAELYAGHAYDPVYSAVRADTGGAGAPNAGATAGMIGGDAIYGGGGGGGGPRDSANEVVGAGGKSGFGGTGGNSGYIASGAVVACTAGTAPGGGGGGSAWDGSTYMPGCAGARGEVRVWW
jgi:hypothetical protein